MKSLLGVIAALAAGVGAGAAGAMPDPEEIAKLGPMLGAFVLYLEWRFRPVFVSSIAESKAHRAEMQAHRAELAAARPRAPQLELVPKPEG